MKLPTFFRKAAAISQKSRQKQRGVAILMVMAILILMSVMAISLFTMSKNEQVSARAVAELNRNYSLRDVAINLVISQIRVATTQVVGNDRTMWVSQPGAITTFISSPSGDNGKPASIFKLYSAKNPLAGASSTTAFAEDLEQAWNTKPHIWADMNRPVFKPSLDPKDANDPTKGTWHYPICDPRPDSTGKFAEGFEYGSKGTKIAGIVSSGNVRALPMPVMWLYVLQNGAVGALDPASNKFLSASPGDTPSAENPIVGRIAYWTDDESCKINVNTSSEGVFWDTPRCDTTEERYFAKLQPTNVEYYRLPGHPFQVSLSSVLFPGERYVPAGSGMSVGKMKDMGLEKAKILWEIGPKVNIGPSGGGVTSSVKNPTINVDSYRLDRQDRFFGSSDEVVFRKDLSAQNRRMLAANDDTVSKQVEDRVKRGSFLLTTKSSAPELNPYGHPKIGMWPLTLGKSSESPIGTTLDKTMSFVTRFGPEANMATGSGTNRYHIVRRDYGSRHHEWGRTPRERNRELWLYLQKVTDVPAPGFPYKGSFKQKYDAPKVGDRSEDFSDRNQILVEFLDYCRGLNMHDPEMGAYSYGDLNGQHAAFCACDANMSSADGGAGFHESNWNRQELQRPKGQGRIFGLSEIAFWFTVNNGYLECGILTEGFCAGQGWGGIYPGMAVAIGGGTGSDINAPPDSLFINGTAVEADPNFNYAYCSSSVTRTGGVAWGGYGGVRAISNNSNVRNIIKLRAKGGQPIPTGGGIDLRGKCRVMVYDSSSAPTVSNLVQVVYLNVPPTSMLAPTSNTPQTMQDRLRNAMSNPNVPLFNQNSDRVISMVPPNPDYRLCTGPRAIKEDYFVINPSTGNLRHSLMEPGAPGMLPGGNFEPLLKNVAAVGGKYQPDWGPIPPTNPIFNAKRLDKTTRGSMDPNITGDFDNGVGSAPDGTYAGKTDEGNFTGNTPYFDLPAAWVKPATPPLARAFSTPSRSCYGPGMFGSISTGLQNRVAFQTLLFRPNGAQNKSHYGSGWIVNGQPQNGTDPFYCPDHLFMEFFWMPVVDPYPISEPLSTKGKINLNYAIQPFDYITRATALHAAMKCERLLAIPNSAAASYKTGGGQSFRQWIDATETMKQFEEVFKDSKRRVFRSASQICEINLVPEGQTASSMTGFWTQHSLTGDNSREAAYAHLYPHLTVRSNIYKVHYLVQTIQKARSSTPDTFDPQKDVVTTEYRGHAVVERYIDPNEKDLASPQMDYIVKAGLANNQNAIWELPKVDDYYRYRIIENKQFSP
ncbi:MAG: Verru_Chthon cassette protein A [Verrucomicrobiales bacterium]|nr:Verru_Chthon cassette protein A [Verrucomicrobiales bacterium]